MSDIQDKATILVVDDSEINTEMLSGILESLGYDTMVANSAAMATELLQGKLPQLILLDIMMPEIDGYQFCRVLKNNPHTREIPVIFVSAADGNDDKEKAFDIGGVDFISKPFDIVEIKARVQTHLNIYKLQRQLENNNRKLNRIINEQSQKIENERKRFLKGIATLSEEVEDSTQHIENVAANSKTLAQALNFTDKYENQISNTFIEGIEIAGAIHDLGKIMVSRDILTKPGMLDDDERARMQMHTVYGSDMLKAAYPDLGENKYAQIAADVVRSHHENWDGSGYPDGMAGDKIPLAARIVRITDAYDALLSSRSYKRAYTKEEAIDILREGKGRNFDPYLLEMFLRIEKRMKS